MNSKDIEYSEPNKQSGEGPVPKKAYQAPRFRIERVFETTALSCGKIVSTQGNCHHVPKSS
jgi:hypothetical protein